MKRQAQLDQTTTHRGDVHLDAPVRQDLLGGDAGLLVDQAAHWLIDASSHRRIVASSAGVSFRGPLGPGLSVDPSQPAAARRRPSRSAVSLTGKRRAT